MIHEIHYIQITIHFTLFLKIALAAPSVCPELYSYVHFLGLSLSTISSYSNIFLYISPYSEQFSSIMYSLQFTILDLT